MSITIDLYKWCNPGVFKLQNDSTGEIELRHSVSMIRSLEAIISEIRAGRHQRFPSLSNLSVEIVEVVDDYELRLLKYNYWYKELSKNSHIINKNTGLEYKVTMDIVVAFTIPKVFVRLKNRNHDSFIVGVFDKLQEAQEFYDRYYTNQPFINRIYAINDETLKYIRNSKGKI